MACTHARSFGLGAASALLLAAGTVHAQTFQRFNGTDLREKAWDIEQTFDGGYVTAGERSGAFAFPGGPPDPADFLITRYDPDGKPIWATQLGGFARDVAYSVHQTGDGGFIVAGQTESAGAVLGLGLVRLDPAGAVLWSNVYPGDVFAELFNPAPDGTRPQVAVRESRESTDIVVVTNRATTSGGQLGVYLRTNAAGFPLTHVTYSDFNGPRTRMGFSDIKEFPNGDLAITGFYDVNVGDPLGLPADADVLTMRIAPSGAPVWIFASGEVTPDGFAQENGYGLDLGPNGDRIVVGAGTDKGTGTLATAHLWFAPTGALLFNNDFEGMAPAYAATRFNDALDVATAGQDYFLAGPGTHGTAAGVSFDFAGSPLWLYTYGPNVAPRDRATAVTPDRAPDGAGCGWAFSAWERYPLALGAEDQHLIKVNDLGASGCCEDRVPFDPKNPPFEQRPLQFQATFDEAFEPWAQWFTIDLGDVIKCYSPDCTPCPADLNGDGVLNVDDIDAFITLFLAGDARADLVCNGALNVDDVDRFIMLFLAGC